MSLTSRATSRGVNVTSVICCLVTGSTMLYAITIAVRSTGVTVYGRGSAGTSAGCGGSDDTPMSTLPAKNCSPRLVRRRVGDVDRERTLPVHTSAAHW